MHKERNVLFEPVGTSISTRLHSCPNLPPNYDEIWSWCHGSRYKVCKGNYPYEKKVEDTKLLLERIGTVFSRHRVSWWIDFTSLQSATVNEGLAPWDYQLEIGVIEKRFRQYYSEIMYELHQCEDPESPLYYKRYSTSDENLRGRFQTKWEPRFWIELNPYYHNENEGILKKAGWGNLEAEQKQMYTDLPYNIVFPLSKGPFNNATLPIPRKSINVLETRFGEDWQLDHHAPAFYRSDLRWGSEEMKALSATG